MAAAMSRLPTGCDQQGRYPEAAEACTELEAEDPETFPEAFWVWLALTAIVVTVLVADLVLK
jgi:hypothetical protein